MAGMADAVAFVLGEKDYLGLLTYVLGLQEESGRGKISKVRMHNK